ncbi:MAG: hypothetical protein AMXMBFR34_12920 [Myxococcaceae bacterium]
MGGWGGEDHGVRHVLLVVLAGAAGGGCRVPAPPAPVVDAGAPEEAAADTAAPAPDDKYEWQTPTADRTALLRSKSMGGRCYLACTQGEARLWEGTGPCLVEKSDRRFVGPGCERTVAFIAAPQRGRPWSQTELMRVLRREALDYVVPGVALLPEEALKTSISWLQGCYAQPGQPPRYSASGTAVEYDMVNGESGTVELIPPPPPPEPEPAPVPLKAKKPKKRD